MRIIDNEVDSRETTFNKIDVGECFFSATALNAYYLKISENSAFGLINHRIYDFNTLDVVEALNSELKLTNQLKAGGAYR